MKIPKNLVVFGSYFVILLILLTGLFSLYSMIKFRENSQIKEEINEFVNELELSIVNFLLLINTDNLADYEEIKADIESERRRIDSLHTRVHPIIEKFNLAEGFDSDFDEFTNISNVLAKIQKETIIGNNEFDQKIKSERSLRHGLRSNVSDTPQLLSDNWRMGYYSKETLYQYRDEKHLNEWIESIEKFIDNVKNSNLHQEIKVELLEKSVLYNEIALDMGNFVLKQVKTEEEKQLKIQELREIADRIEEDGEEISMEISKEIKSQSDSLARNTFLIIIGITVIGIVLLFVFQRYFIGKIKRKNDIKN